MQDKIPIGRFATLTGLTIKALRVYDRRGVLRPALVGFRTGFRYYAREQVATAKHIHLLRSVDMPLDDIRVLLHTSDPTETRLHLARHRRRLEERIAKDQHALTVLQALDAQCQQQRKERGMNQENKPYECSFCGKANAEVRHMIAGPNGVFICDECVAKCNEIIAKEEAKVSSA